MPKNQNLNDSSATSTTDDSSNKKKNVKYINISSLSWKEQIILFTKNSFFKAYTFTITIIILILCDIHKITSIKNDLSFNIILSIFAILIFIEIVIYFVANETYGFSFYFFIDIIFLISLIFEITNIYESLIYKESEDYLRTNMDTGYLINIIKAIRIIRILRIGKLVTMFNYVFLKRKYDDNEHGEENENISTTFINFSSYKIFLFFVLIIFAQIIIVQDLYIENPIFDKNYILKLFSNLNNSNDNLVTKLLIFTSFIETFSKTKESLILARFEKFIYINDTFNDKLRKYEQLIYYQKMLDENNTQQNELSIISNINNEALNSINKELLKNYINNTEYIDKIINNDEDIDSMHFLISETENSEKFEINLISTKDINIIIEKENKLSTLKLIPSETARQHKNIIIYDNRHQVFKYYFLNMVRTVFSLSIFLLIYLLFLYDINNVILSSIQTMVKKVEKMAKNPSLESDTTNENKETNSGCISFLEASKGKFKIDEFKIIINKISKICSLVSFGFGEAGTQIISQVLKEGLNVDINPLIPGKKVMGIYGFCDIRNFTDTTEILKEKVMIFVNQVAEIVHQITADFCGSANKNIGDAFLLVWKLEDRFIKEVVNKQGIKELKLKNVNRINQICDMVLICFIRILIEINKSYKLSEYRHHKGLNARMKNYKTRLGFGLHLGQSIEGAIGSMFKIDASYLSTNVNMANELEENTKTFKKELIMSGDFYDYLSEDAKSYVRLLDIFKTKSGQITRLYSIDLDLESIPIEKKKDSMFKEENIEKKWEIVKQKRKISKILYDDIVLRHKSDIWNEFVSEEDEFKLVREKYPDDFIDDYNNGMEQFRNGNWTEAKNLLTNALELVGGDDPATKLNLAYMEKYKFVPPDNWKGYKEEK